MDDEQNFADMIIMMHCKAAIKSSSRGFCFNANKNSIEVRSLMAPGQKFGDIDVHPNDVERVRRLRPSFNGNFRDKVAQAGGGPDTQAALVNQAREVNSRKIASR